MNINYVVQRGGIQAGTVFAPEDFRIVSAVLDRQVDEICTSVAKGIDLVDDIRKSVVLRPLAVIDVKERSLQGIGRYDAGNDDSGLFVLESRAVHGAQSPQRRPDDLADAGRGHWQTYGRGGEILVHILAETVGIQEGRDFGRRSALFAQLT